MDKKGGPITEIDSLRYDWYEKGAEEVIVHFYAKDVIKCSLETSEEEQGAICILFTTSNKQFIENNCKAAYDGCPSTFLYKIYPSGKVSLTGNPCKLKKTLIEASLKKIFPVTWKSLERLDVKMARQTGAMKAWKQRNVRSIDGKQDIRCMQEPAVKESSNSCTDVTNNAESLGSQHIPKEHLYGRFTPQSQLLGGKSTPISKTEQMNKEKREEGNSSPDDQQPCSSSTDDDSLAGSNKHLSSHHEVLGFNGLENFANNCYLNVVVQVLTNLVEIKDYFESDEYLQHVNLSNPLGSGGKVARAFSDLVKLLWSSGKKSYRPSILKNIMGKRCSIFLGFQQCDAQEFFSSLLDNLHEDLNQGKVDRCLECPTKDTDGPTVNERSDTAWQAHLGRNNSIIVKMFHGQLVSRLTCAFCHKVSHSFDPCAQISLPIPMEKKVFSVVVFFKDPKKTPYSLRVQISTLNAQMWHLINMVSRKIDIPAHCLKAFPIMDGVYQPNLNDNASLRPMTDKKFIVVCEIRGEDEDFFSIPVLQYVSGQIEFSKCSQCWKGQESLTTKLKRCTRCCAVAYCGRDCQSKHWGVHKNACRKDAKVQIGLPFILTLKKSSSTFNTLKDALLHYAYYSIKDEKGNDFFKNQNGEENVGAATEALGATSVPDWGDVSYSEFVLKGFLQCKPDNEGIVIKHDDFKLERLVSFTHLTVDWISTLANDEKGCAIKERLPPIFQSLDVSYSEEKSSVDKCTLEDCLSLFMEPERLSESESWRCPNCKGPQAARKEMSISYPPAILLLHLKRFTFGEVGQKVSKPVNYRVSGFDLSPYIFEDTRSHSPVPYLYDLVGVICHKGTLRMGHYVCMARLLDRNSVEDVGWRFLDDDEITRVREDKVVSPEAYVLVYRLQGLTNQMNVERPLLPSASPQDVNSQVGKSSQHRPINAAAMTESDNEGRRAELAAARKALSPDVSQGEEVEFRVTASIGPSGSCSEGTKDDYFQRSHSFDDSYFRLGAHRKAHRNLSIEETISIPNEVEKDGFADFHYCLGKQSGVKPESFQAPVFSGKCDKNTAWTCEEEAGKAYADACPRFTTREAGQEGFEDPATSSIPLASNAFDVNDDFAPQEATQNNQILSSFGLTNELLCDRKLVTENDLD